MVLASRRRVFSTPSEGSQRQYFSPTGFGAEQFMGPRFITSRRWDPRERMGIASS